MSSSSRAPLNEDAPLALEAPNTMELVSVEQSKITNINLYYGRAEITRAFHLDVELGQNDVTIMGLPQVMDWDSLRVEGHGSATIHGVTVSSIPQSASAPPSEALRALKTRRRRVKQTLKRYQTALSFLEKSLATFSLVHSSVAGLGTTADAYTTESDKLDNQVFATEEELQHIDDEITQEEQRLRTKSWYPLTVQAKIRISANKAAAIDLMLTYAVHSATWSPGFDVRVDTNAEGKQISLTYKASLNQQTGESWENVSLTLHTATPTFGVEIPKLTPQRLALYNPKLVPTLPKSYPVPMMAPTSAPPPMAHAIQLASFSRSRSRSRSPSPNRGTRRHRRSRSYSRSRSRSPRRGPEPLIIVPAMGPMTYGVGASGPSPQAVMPSMGAHVASSNTSIVATFKIPGLINVPSDQEQHSVIIAQLDLDADLSWIVVPKKDTRAHLQASIKNTSQFTFLHAKASVYVDGSFIAKSTIPAVSPQETFDCPLGIDPSIRVEYHPKSKKVSSKSGFLQNSKNTYHEFEQRITVFNTKSITIPRLLVLDQVPVSEDSRISVKVTSPALSSSSGPTVKSLLTERGAVGASESVKAQWVGSEENGSSESSSGTMVNKDGRFNWICSIPPQGKTNLILQCEVVYPANMAITGL
ncbi:hypothetical protein HGRIS_005769 [Hohenbuehelia grisea]|uniref:Mucoidy inhibitor A n=1 Tax=Hohenbuehelia grisea TaxID=104357 RepID=A0ABR3JZX4_9AGAR